MLRQLTQPLRPFFRERGKAISRGGWYPILLPHFRLTSTDLSAPGGPPREVSARERIALSLCDGRHTLTQIAWESGETRASLLARHDADTLLLWPRPLPASPVDLPPDRVTDIIISPHLDDALLSLGRSMLGLQAARQRGLPVGCLVLDVFSNVSWWRFDLSPEILPRVQATRDAEEEIVMRLAGATVRRVGLSEAPLRGYPLKEIFTADVRPDDYAAAAPPIQAAVRSLRAEFPKAAWHLPLGVGNHVDHRIARDAALEALDDVTFYEDLPYAAQPGGVADYARFVPGRVLRPLRLPGGSLAMKLRLLRAYGSQLVPSQIRAVGEYARRVLRRPGERAWGAAR